MSKPIFANVWWDPALGNYRVQNSYDGNFYQYISKSGIIPWEERAWDAPTRTWVFSEQYLDTVLAWIKECFPGVTPNIKLRAQVEQEARNLLPPGEMNATARAAIVFVDLLTPAELALSYRAAAKRLHPDTGGSKEHFQDLSTAYAELNNGKIKP